MKCLSAVFAVLSFPLWTATAMSQYIIEDQGVGLTRAEVEQVVKRWTPQMRAAAANDHGDRLELLNVALASKKLALEGDKFTEENDGDTYWKYVLVVRSTKQNFVLNNFMTSLEIPDMEELSEELYLTAKDKYAKVPERRYSSHLLFKCFPGQCDRTELKVKAQVVLDELRAGADFVAYVHKYSDDLVSKAKDGVFDKWMELGEEGVEPHYTGGVFSIDKIGDYSDLVETRFGVHIIRLDGIRESHYLPYEDLKDGIIQRLENEFKMLSAKEFNAKFQITDDAYIDGAAMEAIFEPYKTDQYKTDQ